jgi:hypothetical protein
VRNGIPGPGFIRRDVLDRHRFIFDNGDGYYPLGNNAAWDSGPDIAVTKVFAKMGEAGENWSRVWMDHWDGKNLDWVQGRKLPLGYLDLTVAAKWDAIVRAAEKAGIHFQMTLQHHGQYSTRTDPNWKENPWNAANGGFLASPEEFFSSPRAKALTKAKFRYIIARWGYSPSVMAWELFNEVQWTDAVANGRQADVAAWHDEMAAFIRQQDPYHHLITSSFGLNPKVLGTHLDYWQPHDYAPDPISTAAKLNGSKLDRPAFIGEIGPPGDRFNDDGEFLHNALWASLMSDASGAAQYWSWEQINRRGLYSIIKSATTFAKWTGIASRRHLAVVNARVESGGYGPLAFGAGIAAMPAYLQGDYHRAMFPSATFHVDYPAAGTFTVEAGKSAKAGARLEISVDGDIAQTAEFQPAATDATVIAAYTAAVPAGPHTILVRNTGLDWFTVNRFVLDPYAPRFGIAARGNSDVTVAWVYNRAAKPGSGLLRLPGLKRGAYEVTWWDTDKGGVAGTSKVKVAADGVLSCPTPVVSRDIAVRIVRRYPGRTAFHAARPARHSGEGGISALQGNNSQRLATSRNGDNTRRARGVMSVRPTLALLLCSHQGCHACVATKSW